MNMNALSTVSRKLTTPSKRRPFLFELRSSTWFITITVCTAIFTDIFLYAVIVPVFPFSLVDRVHVDDDDVQHWLSILLSVYSAALLVSAPIFGWLSDRIEYRRTVLLAGIVVLGGATVMLCLARNLALLVVGRLLQGASGGVVWVAGLALLADTVGKDRAGQAMGYVGVAYSSAALLAPLLGGIVYQAAGYYAVFAMGFSLIALDVVLRLLLIEKKAANHWLSAEDTRIRTQTLANDQEQAQKQNVPIPIPTAQPVLDDSDPEVTGTTQPDSETGKVLSPMLILLKSHRMQAVFFACTICALIFSAFDTTLPLFVEQTFHWTSLGAGLIFLAPIVPSFFQPLYGHVVDKYGARWPAGIGLLIAVPPAVCLRFVIHNTIQQKVLLCALLTIIGFGTAVTLAATMAEFTYIAAEKERRQPGSMGKGGAYAQSYSLFNVSWAFGSLVGAFWGGGIRQAAGFGTLGWSLGLLCGVFCVPTVLFVGGNMFRKGRAKEVGGGENGPGGEVGV